MIFCGSSTLFTGEHHFYIDEKNEQLSLMTDKWTIFFIDEQYFYVDEQMNKSFYWWTILRIDEWYFYIDVQKKVK